MNASCWSAFSFTVFGLLIACVIMAVVRDELVLKLLMMHTLRGCFAEFSDNL